MHSVIYHPEQTLKLNLTSESMPSQCQPSPGVTWWRSQQRHRDPILSTVYRLTLNGFPLRCTNVPRIVRNYWDFWNELSINDDLLMKGERVVIPTSCRDFIMEDLHKGHEGINKAMSLARTCVYWPSMEADVTDYIKRCLTCIDSCHLQVETLHPYEVPPGPWLKEGMGFFQDDLGKKYLIIVDYFSKFPYIYPIASSHHFKTINYLWELFTTEGIPTIVMSDNVPPFNGDDFKRFAREFNFVHTTSSPHFHQSNGFIEAMVKKVKNTYKNTDGSPNAQARALLQLCDTPILTDLPLPAEILHGRPAQGAILSRHLKHQFEMDSAETDRNPEHPKRAVWQVTQSKGSSSPQSEWTSKVLPQQIRDRPNDLFNRNCEQNTGLWSFIHNPRPKQQSLQEKQSTFKAHLLWQHNIPDLYNSKRGQTAWNTLLSRPQTKKGENRVLPDGHHQHDG